MRTSTARTSAGAAALFAGWMLLAPGCNDGNDPVEVPTTSSATSTYDASVATAWYDELLILTKRTPGYTPPVAARAFAYAGIALYETVVPGMADHRSLVGLLNGFAGLPTPVANTQYNWNVAANAALASIARHYYPTAPDPDRAAVDALESSLAASLAAGVDAAVVERSTAWGRDVADAVFGFSITDGGHEGYLHNFPTSYVPPSGPGLWVPTPRPNNLPPQSAMQPYWGANRPFALPASGNPNVSCDPGPPIAYSEDMASPFYGEANEVYTVTQALTTEQADIARFWSDDPGLTFTPPGHSISILSQVVRADGTKLDVAAEAYARLGIAVSDAFVSCWYCKFQRNVLRPITYIQLLIDPNWVPLLATPPFPEYTSGHSVQSGAAAFVLTTMFGANHAFEDHTQDTRVPPLPSRSFASFDAAAQEAAISRLYGGIHYRAAIVKGLEQGRGVGAVVMALPLRRSTPMPVDSPL